jgi:glucokinase
MNDSTALLVGDVGATSTRLTLVAASRGARSLRAHPFVRLLHGHAG